MCTVGVDEPTLLLLQRWRVGSDAIGPHVGEELLWDLRQSLPGLQKRRTKRVITALNRRKMIAASTSLLPVSSYTAKCLCHEKEEVEQKGRDLVHQCLIQFSTLM